VTLREEYKLVEILCTGVTMEKALTPWEKNFINDLHQRYADWGSLLKVSDKMWDVLEKIRDKCDAFKY